MSYFNDFKCYGVHHKGNRKPIMNLTDLSRLIGKPLGTIRRRFDKTGSLETKFARKTSKYYDRAELLAWAKSEFGEWKEGG